MIYDAVSDGKHILYGMLITALVFCAILVVPLVQHGNPYR